MAVEDLVRSEVNRITSGSQPPAKTRPNPLGKVDGFVSNPKKSPLKKFAEVFFEEDLNTVKRSIARDVIKPTIKGLAADILIGGIEQMFYGESGRKSNYASRGITNSLVGSISTTPYNDYTRSQTRSRSPQPIEEKPRLTYHVIPMRDISSAQDFVNKLQSAVRDYNNISVSELYEALSEQWGEVFEIDTDWNDCNWGWTNLDGLKPSRGYGGLWEVRMPDPVPLRNNK